MKIVTAASHDILERGRCNSNAPELVSPTHTPHPTARFASFASAKLVMLTGDNEAAGRAIGELARVDEVHAELLPNDKVALIEHLTEAHEYVAKVGDGVNEGGVDSKCPALSRRCSCNALSPECSETQQGCSSSRRV
jgi:hypothetical protein